MSDVKEQAKSLETSMFLQNIVKLIPVEIMAIYAVINGLIPVTADPMSIVVVMGILTILIPFYAKFAMKIGKVSQIILMTVAFPIWIIAIGGFPAGLSIAWYQPWMMSVGLAMYTLIPPMIYGYRAPVQDAANIKLAEPTDVPRNTDSMQVTYKSWREI